MTYRSSRLSIRRYMQNDASRSARVARKATAGYAYLLAVNSLTSSFSS